MFGLTRWNSFDDVFNFQRDVMTAPIQQRDANLHLELADLLAERWLRCVQPGRGAREIQFFRDRHEVPQMPQFHPERLDGAAKNRNPGIPAVSRGTSYEMFSGRWGPRRPWPPRSSPEHRGG